MNKPLLIVVTGRPGSGKTTLAQQLGQKMHLPVISRDAIKEGYVHSQGVPHAQLPDGNLTATNLFFQIMENLLDGGVSLIAEAAFQHPLWSAKLEPLRERARISVIICQPGDDLTAHERYIRRGLADPSRVYFHGDAGVAQARQGERTQPASYAPPQIDVPTLWVDTTDGYVPSMEELVAWLLKTPCENRVKPI